MTGDPGLPTLDQLRIFLAIVDEGGFAAAARRLNRAVSVISYGLANLEAQLGLRLFDREGARKPLLTAQGRALVAEARAIAGNVDGLRAKVKGMLEGLEPALDLVVDVLLPTERLGVALRAFAAAFPSVQLRLHVEAMGAVAGMVLDGTADIGLSGPHVSGVDGLDSRAVGSVPLIPVAAPDHPLARAPAVAPGAWREHIQLVLSDRSTRTAGRDFGVLSARTWRLADLGAKHALLREGIGWGNMPQPMIEADLAAGMLVPLGMPDYHGEIYPFAAIWRRDAPPGPAASWLIDRFAALAGISDLTRSGKVA